MPVSFSHQRGPLIIDVICKATIKAALVKSATASLTVRQPTIFLKQLALNSIADAFRTLDWRQDEQ